MQKGNWTPCTAFTVLKRAPESGQRQLSGGRWQLGGGCCPYRFHWRTAWGHLPPTANGRNAAALRHRKCLLRCRAGQTMRPIEVADWGNRAVHTPPQLFLLPLPELEREEGDKVEEDMWRRKSSALQLFHFISLFLFQFRGWEYRGWHSTR